jgi:hypothetical protein
VELSQQVSNKVPHLSFDVIGAFLEHFQLYTSQQREYGLLYIEPWIPQMETQLRTGTADFAETTKEIKSILRALIRLTYEKPQVRHLTVDFNVLAGMVHAHLANNWEGNRTCSNVAR